MENKKNWVDCFNNYLYKPILFRDITKKDGYIALILVVFVMVMCFCILAVFTDKDKIFLMGTIFLLLFSLLLTILNRKKLNTLGFRKIKWKETLVTLLTFLTLALVVNIKQIHAGKVTILGLTFNAAVYLLYPGFLEEFIFRGYLWPRLVVLCGKHKGSLLCGTVFGFMHLILPVYYGYDHLTFLQVSNSIFDGIVTQYSFALFYSFSQNIYFPSIVHAAPHFFAIGGSLKRTLHIFNISI